MHRRKNKSGFTLIELMVVILILGILAGVVGVAVVGIITGSKAKLDATALGEYAKFLSLALQDGGEAKVSRNYTEKKGGADLLQWLCVKEIIKVDQAKKLAGASGTEGNENDWKGSTAIDTNTMCIFTCPSEGPKFARRATSKTSADGVFMCYNENFAFKYPDDGMVILPAGVQKAQLVKYVEIEDIFKDAKESKVRPTLNDMSFYGKFPFKDIPSK
jgi:prepilin-type N-terminal cleavage/methylation domain-containing protein